MDYRSLHSKTVADLRRIAREAGVKVPSGTTKAILVELILEKQRTDADAVAKSAPQTAAQEIPAKQAGLAETSSGTEKTAEAAPGGEDLAEAKRAEAPVRRRGAPRKTPDRKAEQAEADPAEPAARAEAAPGGEDPAEAKRAEAPARRRGAPQKTPDRKAEQAEADPAKPAARAEAAPGGEDSVEAKGAEAPKRAAEAEQAEAVPAEASAPVERRSAEAEGAGARVRMEDRSTASREDGRRTSGQAYATRTNVAAPDSQGAARGAAAALPEAQVAPAEVQQRPAYQRPMSTQQRMGARTQPVSGPYRTQARNSAPGRFNAETTQARPRNFENAPGYRRPAAGEGAQIRSGYRRAGEDVPQGAYRRPLPPPEVQAGDAAARSIGEGAPARRPLVPEEGAQNVAEGLNAGVPELLSNGDCGDGAGILEIHPDGYGFLRAENYLPGNRDVYVSAAQIRRFNLRTGDYVVGKTRAQQMDDRSVGLIYINEVNGQTPDMARRRRPFDSLVPVYPDTRLRMERAESSDISLRLIDMIAPIGKGQRGMIVSQPKAGKTTLLKKIANAITANNPDVHLIVLLIDERPEEVTDMKRSIQGEVVYSTFDEAPETHTRVSEMVLERAQRLVELGKDVVVLLDSITRLARAYNLVIPPTGRSLSGGLDPGALFRPKRFFGAARNIENGGSLTIIATALVDTGSRMDDIIFEEFKGTGNMELHLDRSLSDRRIFPAIDLYRSGTRREELLLTKEELEGVYQVRRMLSKGSPQEAAEQLISLMEKTRTNLEFFQKLKGWLNVCEKDGFSMR